jgi:hypothetical protein
VQAVLSSFVDAQVKQEVDPWVVLAFPSSQAGQLLDAIVSLYFPASQFTHGLSPI